MNLFGLDPRLPVTASDCMVIGIAGNCGVDCPVFVNGECDEPQEISKKEVLSYHGKGEAIEIFKLYDCFNK